MKIFVKTDDLKRNINIYVPMCLLATALRFSDTYIKKYANIEYDWVKNFDKKTLIKGLKYLKKHHKGLVLVDIESSSGEIIKIKI